MKKFFEMALAVAVMMTASCVCVSCSSDADSVAIDGGDVQTVDVTFSMQGEFTLQPFATTRAMTRAAIEADGRAMTDVWVLDYQDGALVQQLHQGDNTAADFGQPTLTMTTGAHHLYFVVSRGGEPTLDTAAHTLAWQQPSDTFWAHVELAVTNRAGGVGSRTVTLDRVVTKVKMVISDALPAGIAKATITPATWHYGMDYLTAAPAATQSAQPYAITIPSTHEGRTGVSVSLLGFSGADEWTTDVTLTALDATDAVLGTATVAAVPFRRNRTSELAGRLFSGNAGMALSLNGAWEESYAGEW